jgi:UDPglucose--hexose-1-phosphate uridylyltransferase
MGSRRSGKKCDKDKTQEQIEMSSVLHPSSLIPPPSTNPHRRYNPLTGEWILVSPQRTQRPWLGQVEKPTSESRPAYDPRCYLCPGNERAGGNRNPQYDGTFVFDNDFAALLPDLSAGNSVIQDMGGKANLLLRAENERGLCRVICFSPRHDWTLPEMPLADIRQVVQVWIDQTRELGALDFINYVQVFENKGAMMGASNPHPHCQAWASAHVPTEPAKELRSQIEYLHENGLCLLCDYLALEIDAGERIILQNDHFVALVPFWAMWPFETMVLAKRHCAELADLNDTERGALAEMVKCLTTRYDNLFNVSFPYSMGWHQAPMDGIPHPETHLHAHYYPPLLRSATVRKFMVGYELLGNPQRDITAESAAARLREMSDSLNVKK